ncbi:FHA domain-containing protein, partial [uncultured Clostridium sp.]|uniref:FHA domain-containing protein n=1 Tax=uncultured Clostridium sp. TaxID=59620 RepID=UPI0026F43A98
MIIRLIKKTKIYNFSLPTKISGNYWIKDDDRNGNERNLINVEASDGRWKIKSDFETKIMSGNKELESAYLKEYNLYFLKVNTDGEYVILYCSPSIDPEISKLRITRNGDILIGNDPNAHINYSYPLVSRQHAKLTYSNGVWAIKDLNSKYGTYVNNYAVTSRVLSYG